MKFRNTLIFITLLIMVVAIPFLIYTTKQSQELRKKAAPATVLTISPATKDIKTGEKFSLDVNIETGENSIGAVKLFINFDKTKLKGESIEVGSFLTILVVEGAVGDSILSITLGSPTANLKKGSGNLAKITFTALESIGASTISFDNKTEAAGYTADVKETVNVVVNKASATVNITAVEGDTPTATPTDTPTPTNTPLPTNTPAPTNTPLPTNTPTQNNGGNDNNNDNNNNGSDSLRGGTGGADIVTALTLTYPRKGAVVKIDKPTFTGTAKAGSTITYTIYSDPITGVVTANENGNFEFTPDSPLADASHNITLTEEFADGTSRTLASNFVVQTKAPPVSGNIKPIFIIGVVAIGLILLGFGIPLIP